MARIRRIEIEDPDMVDSITISSELRDEYYREVAERTVKPVLSALRGVWDSNRGFSWNHIVGAGLTAYSLLRKGIDDRSVEVAVSGYLRAKGYRNTQRIAREIVSAVKANL